MLLVRHSRSLARALQRCALPCSSSAYTDSKMSRSVYCNKYTSSLLFIPPVQVRSFSLWGGSTVPPVPTESNMSGIATKVLQEDTTLSENSLQLMEAPPIPSAEMLLEPLNSTLDDFGLASVLTPAGWIRRFVVFSQYELDAPWWVVILACAVTIRLLTLPLFIMAQKNTTIMQVHGPTLSRLMGEIKEAQDRKDHILMAEKAMDLQDFKKKTDFKISRLFLPVLGQGVAFGSVFFALRSMASVSFPGFSTGGCLWFPDLLACDPFILPAVNALSMYYILKKGVETGFKMEDSPGLSQSMSKFLLYGGPVMIFFFGKFYFPSSMVLYWVISNFISIILGQLLRTASVRTFFKLPPLPAKPFKKSFKEKYMTKAGIKTSFKESRQTIKTTCTVLNPFTAYRRIKVYFKKTAKEPELSSILANDARMRSDSAKKPLIAYSRDDLQREEIIKKRLRQTVNRNAKTFTPGSQFDPQRMNR